MKEIRETIPRIHRALKKFDLYFDGLSYAVLDIETTGLSPAYSRCILSGLVTVSPAGETAELFQFFAESPDEEPDVLRRTLEVLEGVDFLITYNGRFFDIPFLKKRAERHGLAMPARFDLDLFTLMKYHSDLPNVLPSMSQKSLEVFAGLSDARTDEISGGDSVALYERYHQRRDPEDLRRILLHNRDDIRQLYRLLDLIRYADLDRALGRTGFPVKGALIRSVDCKKGEVIIKGTAEQPVDYIRFPSAEAPYAFRMSATDGQFDLTIPCETRGKACFFDCRQILGCDPAPLSSLPAYADGFLIAKEDKTLHYLELNLFALRFVPALLEQCRSGEYTLI